MNSAASRPPLRSRAPARRSPPSAHQGEPGDVDVWRAGLDGNELGTLARLQALMSTDEVERARRFHFERDRRRFIVARGILRTLLGKYLSRPPRELQFQYGPHGRPMVSAEQAGVPPLRFNLAHAGDVALYAFTREGQIGVDLERVREMPDWDRIAAATFSPPETARLRTMAPERRTEAFFAAWVREEAQLKALGLGLGGAAERRPDPVLAAARGEREDPAGGAMERGRGGPRDDRGFAVPVFRPAPGFVAALAAQPGERWVTCLTWPATADGGQPFSRRGRRVRLEHVSNQEDLFT